MGLDVSTANAPALAVADDDPEEPRCVECGRTPRPDENPDDEWRAESDGVGELLVFCPECWQREFGSSA